MQAYGHLCHKSSPSLMTSYDYRRAQAVYRWPKRYDSPLILEWLILGWSLPPISRGQVGYMLGDAGRSFVVGYGKDHAMRAYRRCASCICQGILY